jgi:hypothetical protein
MATPYTIACTVHLCRQGPGGPSALRAGPETTTSTLVSGRVPRLARLLALAHRFDKLLRDGMVHNLKTLARLGHVSPARISQILSLLHLAPDIQEALLFRSRPEHGRDCLDMRRVLPLTKIVDWQEQRRLWRRLAEVRQRA